jgi:hypothetical protein
MNFNGDNQLAMYVTHLVKFITFKGGAKKKFEVCPPSNFFLRPPLITSTPAQLDPSHNLLLPEILRWHLNMETRCCEQFNRAAKKMPTSPYRIMASITTHVENI